MLTSHGRFPIQFHLNAGQPHAPLYGVPRAPTAPPPPLPPLPLPCRLSNCNLATEEGAFVCERVGLCVCVCIWGVEGGVLRGLDWQPTGYSCHNIRCILSLCVQWAAERITVKWDDINYPNPDSSLWNSASTHLSQERTWMVRQRECQRNEMKAGRFSREYSQQKGCLLNKVVLLFSLSFSFPFMISWSRNCPSFSSVLLSSCN